MLNEKRIRLMTKAAEFEQKEGREAFRINDYFRGDYVTFHMVKAWIRGTAAWLILAVLWIVCRLDVLMQNLYQTDFAELGMSMLKWYILFIAVYEILMVLIYSGKYTRTREALKGYYVQLKELEGLYGEEDKRLEGRETTTGGLYDDDNNV